MKCLLCNGTFLTMEESCPKAEAVLVEDGRIQGVGRLDEMRYRAPQAKIRDMEGRTVIPGFVDGHSHITAVAKQMMIADLKPAPAGSCESVEDVVRILKEFHHSHRWRPGQWVMGSGYDNSVFQDGRHPTREDLDLVSREIPVLAVHISGHMCVANTKALDVLGYGGPHPHVPEGGVVEPGGLLKEQAFIGAGGIPAPSGADLAEAVKSASELYASYGFTTVQDGKTTEQDFKLLREAGRTGGLKNDVVCYFDPAAAEEYLPMKEPCLLPYENGVRPAGMKLFLDGSPQGKTAWLSRPYLVPPEGESREYRGFGVMDEEELVSRMRQCLRNHWQVNVHANGDEAIGQMIRCYGRAMEETGSREQLRPVVIHCQTVRDDQLREMKRLGILASFFLDHVYYWGDYHLESVLGPERAGRISPLRSAAALGIPFTLHQDSPVVPPNMLLSVHNAVNRRTRKGRVLGREQRISALEALRAATIGGAYQIFEEKEKGSLLPGKRADLAVLDGNPLEGEAEAIQEIQVVETIKSGKTVYRMGDKDFD